MGVCECVNNTYGPDCSLSDSLPIIITPNQTAPQITIGGAGSNVTFTLSFKDIQEIDASDNVLTSYDLTFQNISVMGSSIIEGGVPAQRYSYLIVLPNSANIVINFTVFANATRVLFGNHSVDIAENGLKYTMQVSNWDFANFKNKLLIHMETSPQYSPGDCATNTIGTDGSLNLKWLEVNLHGTSLYVTFDDYAVIDAQNRRVQIVYDRRVSLIAITVPHFWYSAAFDPNFQVLLNDAPQGSQTFQTGECSSSVQSNSGSNLTGTVIGATIGSVLGVALLVGLGMLALKRHQHKNTIKRHTRMNEASEFGYATVRKPKGKVSYNPTNSNFTGIKENPLYVDDGL